MNNKLFAKPILLYSSYCEHSNQLLNKLIKDYPSVFEEIIRINIDVSKETRKRPDLFYLIQENLGDRRVNSVPVLIVSNGPNITILKEDSILHWADMKNKTVTTSNNTKEVSNQNKEDGGLVAFNHMEAFSNQFASLNNQENNESVLFKNKDPLATRNSLPMPAPNVVMKRKEEVSEIIKPVSSTEVGSKDEVKKRYEELLASRKDF